LVVCGEGSCVLIGTPGDFSPATHLSSSELKRCFSCGIDRSSVPFGTGGRVEFASKLFDPFCIFSSSSSSESLSLADESMLISDTFDEVESESSGEDTGCCGSCRVGAEVVRGGKGGGAFSSSLSLPVAISKLSNSLKVYLGKVISSESHI
jgi:hypothetical protein